MHIYDPSRNGITLVFLKMILRVNWIPSCYDGRAGGENGDAAVLSVKTNVSDRGVGPDTISDTFCARILDHPRTLKMQ